MVTIKEMGSAMRRAMQWLATAAAAAVMASPAAASTITYYHNDLAGSPVAATNSSAQVVWRESYRPYGERLRKSAAAKANDVWFTSRRQDSTGLVYMGARYYDPVTGRFVSTDPKQFDEASLQSFNRYEYANDNPYKYVDPDGKWATILVRAEYSVVFAVATQLGARALGLAIGAGLYDWVHNEQADDGAKGGNAQGAGRNDTASNDAHDAQPRAGEAGGPGPGKVFGERARDRIRDRDDNKCVFCGKETTREPGPDQSQIDHAWPRSRGGNNSDNNGQNTCRTCNLDKGARTTDEYLGQRRQSGE